MSESIAGAPSAAPSSPTSTPSTSSTGSNAPVSSSSNTQSSVPQSVSQSAPEYREIKVNGKVTRVMNNEIDNYLSMGLAAQTRFEEASKLSKRADSIIKNATSNPVKALMDAGLTKEQARDAFEKWYMNEFVEPNTLSKEQLELRDLKEEKRIRDEERKQAEEHAKNQQLEQATARYRDYYSNQIIETLEKSGLPKTVENAQRIAFYMQQAHRNKWDAPLDFIISQVKKERSERIRAEVGNLDVQALIELHGGDEFVKKVNKYYLEQLRAKRKGLGMQQQTSIDGYNNSSKERHSMEEVNRRLREMRTKGEY